MCLGWRGCLLTQLWHWNVLDFFHFFRFLFCCHNFASFCCSVSHWVCMFCVPTTQVHYEQCCTICILSESEWWLYNGECQWQWVSEAFGFTLSHLLELYLYLFMSVCNQTLKTQVEYLASWVLLQCPCWVSFCPIIII